MLKTVRPVRCHRSRILAAVPTSLAQGLMFAALSRKKRSGLDNPALAVCRIWAVVIY